MGMFIFPVNRSEVQKTWLATLTGKNLFSRHRMLVICGNLFCSIGFANLGKYALMKGVRLEETGIAMAAALFFQGAGGYYAYLLFRSMRKMLPEHNIGLPVHDLLHVSYLGFRLYFTLLLGLGCVAMLVPTFLKF